MELGNVKIYFGKVKSVSDEDKICRCQIQIPGFTDQLTVEDLPWYYPIYGLNYLPKVDEDSVSVIVFDNNFSTAFYGPKINITKPEIDDDDYENYLEIFKREVDSKQIQLTYTLSKGIEFINDKSSIQIEAEKLTASVDGTPLVIEKDKITLGSDGLQKTLLGENTVDMLVSIVNLIEKRYNDIINILTAIPPACATPFTAPIASALLPLLNSIPNLAKPDFIQLTNVDLNKDTTNLLSKLVQNG